MLPEISGQNITNTIFKRSAFLSLARLLQVAVTFCNFWLFSLYLPRDQYGLYQKTFVLVSLFSGLCCLSLPLLIASLPSIASGKYIIRIVKKFKLLYALFALGTAIFILCFAAFIPFGVRCITLLLVFCNAAYLIMEVYLVKIHRDNYVLVNNVFYSLLYFSLHYLALKQPGFNLQQLLTWLLLLSFVRIILILVSNRPFIKKDLDSSHDAGLDAVYFKQWKFLSLNEGLELFSRHIDKFFLIWLLTAGGFAVYFNGSYEIPLIGILITTTGTFITMQTVKQQDHVQVKQILQQSSLVLACILFPLFFFLFFNAHELFSLIFNGRYDESVPVFLISCCIIPLRIINYTAILQGYHKGKEILAGSFLGLFIQVILIVLLYSLWDLRGVALAFILGTFVQAIYYLLKTVKVLNSTFSNLLPYTKLLLLFMISGIFSYGPQLVLKNFPPLLFLVSQGIICLLISAAGLLLLLRKRKTAQ